MRIIAVMSPKGGIGKTTTSDAIAYMLGEEQEKRVLILDGDPQGDTCMSSRVGAYRTGVLIMGKSTSRGGFSETKRTANMFSRWIFDTFSRVLTMMS